MDQRMTSERPGLPPWRAVLYGAGVVGAIDWTYATLFVVLKGIPWYRPWQGVASALLGSDAMNGGLPVALFGILLHFTVAACIVTVYLIASRWLPVLRKKSLLWGLAYGGIAFFVMNLVVVPLTHIGPHPLKWSAFNVGGLLVHVLFIGPAAAYFAGRATWKTTRQPSTPDSENT